MFTLLRARVCRAIAMTAVAAVVGLAAVACGSNSSSGLSGMDHSPTNSASQHEPGMSTGDGLAASAFGFRFAPSDSSLPAGQAASLRFQIQSVDGKPVTVFERDQTKLMHFYLIRSNLT